MAKGRERRPVPGTLETLGPGHQRGPEDSQQGLLTFSQEAEGLGKPGWDCEGSHSGDCALRGASSRVYRSDPCLPSPAGRVQSRSGGTCGPVGDPDPNCPSACSAKAQPCCPGSPPAGRSSFRMSRRCCVASSMSMLAQEAMGPATGALSAPSSCRCRCALSSRVQPHRGQTAGCRSLHSVHPQPTNRGPRRVPEPLQPHQPPPLPARPIFGSRNLHLLKKGSGLGADALLFLSRVSSDAPPVCQRGPGSLAGLRQSKRPHAVPPKALQASGYPAWSMPTPKAWAHDGPRTGSTRPPRLFS